MQHEGEARKAARSKDETRQAEQAAEKLETLPVKPVLIENGGTKLL
jgi:hypothetical protein